MRKPDSMVVVPCKSVPDFLRQWFTFLKPLHKLTDREIDVISGFVAHRYELGKVIHDQGVLDRCLMSADTKRKIREEYGISLQNFQVIMSSLRKHNVIQNNRINPRYIPDLGDNMTSFQMLLHFDIK